MSHCGVFALPDGRVGIVRPNPILVAALMAPIFEAAMALLAGHGLVTDVVQPLYDAMTARTEQEAIRVIAERDAPRTAVVQGFLPTDAANLAVHEATGILHPDARRLSTSAAKRFRDCWRRVGPSLPQVDMPLARIQRMNEVRVERRPKLTKSDVDLLKAQESGNTTLQTQLRTYRQALRDLPQTEQVNVDACTTPEQLYAWAPTWPTDPAA